jgi:hypothetical protein
MLVLHYISDFFQGFIF